MNSEEIHQAYLKSYNEIIVQYLPEAKEIINRISNNYDLTIPFEKAGYKNPGRQEFVSKITSMVSCFVGHVETSRLEKELRAVSIDLSKHL